MDLLKLAIVFILTLVFLGLKKPLYIVMLGASVLLGALFSLPALDWLVCYGRALIAPSTLEVMFCLWFVMLLEAVMDGAGYLNRMTEAVDELFHSRKIDIIAMPVIIGFLPSAGGAIFSAPMVERTTQDYGFSAETKALINVYYRHILELFFPTYASVILLARLSGISPGLLTAYLFPMGALMTLLGLWLVRQVPKDTTREKTPLIPRIGRFFAAMWPFFLLLALVMAMPTGIHIPCLITLIVMILVVRLPLRQLPRLIKEKTKLPLLAMTLSVMAFKDILAASGATEHLPEAISALPVPPVLVFSLLALIISMITGVGFAPAPIVIPLALAAIPDFSVADAAFIQLGVYIGAQITPLHLCIPLTAGYFQAHLHRVLLKSLPLYAVALAAGLLFYVVLPG